MKSVLLVLSLLALLAFAGWVIGWMKCERDKFRYKQLENEVG